VTKADQIVTWTEFKRPEVKGIEPDAVSETASGFESDVLSAERAADRVSVTRDDDVSARHDASNEPASRIARNLHARANHDWQDRAR